MELQRIRRDLEIEHACLKTWFRCNFTNPGCSRGLGKQPAQPFPHRRGCLSQAPAGPSPRWSLRHGYRCHTLGEDMIGSHTPLCVPKSRERKVLLPRLPWWMVTLPYSPPAPNMMEEDLPPKRVLGANQEQHWAGTARNPLKCESVSHSVLSNSLQHHGL